MNRRRFLGTVGAGLAVASAGCLGGSGDESSGTRTPGGGDPAAGANVSTDRSRAGSLTDPDLPLDDGELKRGAAKDAIPAITEPAFGADWSGVDASLDDGEQVIGVAVEGEARAYPLAVFNYHEIVNDTFGGPLLVTYCPLCGSGVTAERRVNGQVTTFGVSGLLWHSDLVMYDDLTGSLWSQILGKAVKGPETGESLALRPSTMTTWGAWRDAYPDTTVLLPPPESGTISDVGVANYDRNPYAGYDETERIGISRAGRGYTVHPKTTVVGVATDGAARAYPLPQVEQSGGIVNDRVGDLPVVVAVTTGNTLVAYVRRVDGEVLTFSRVGDGDVLAAGGSRWDPVTGRALDGPHEGTTLQSANDRSPMFWFAWREFYPGSDVYGRSV